MKRKFNVTGSDRKALVTAIETILQQKAVYKKAPTFEYEVGEFTIDKEGAVTCEDTDALERLVHNLIADGFRPEDLCDAEETAEAVDESEEMADAALVPAGVTVSLPLAGHTANTLRNLVNLIYTRASLINKALGTSFSADQGLVEVLANNEDLHTAEDFWKVVEEYEKAHEGALSCITITSEKVYFTSLPEGADEETIRAYTELCAFMNKQALSQKRIQAKTVNEENEKYALRIWLTRLGMNGPEYKATRKILMEKLSGHTAFRTEEERQHWMERHAAKHEAGEVTEA